MFLYNWVLIFETRCIGKGCDSELFIFSSIPTISLLAFTCRILNSSFGGQSKWLRDWWVSSRRSQDQLAQPVLAIGSESSPICMNQLVMSCSVVSFITLILKCQPYWLERSNNHPNIDVIQYQPSLDLELKR